MDCSKLCCTSYIVVQQSHRSVQQPPVLDCIGFDSIRSIESVVLHWCWYGCEYALRSSDCVAFHGRVRHARIPAGVVRSDLIPSDLVETTVSSITLHHGHAEVLVRRNSFRSGMVISICSRSSWSDSESRLRTSLCFSRDRTRCWLRVYFMLRSVSGRFSRYCFRSSWSHTRTLQSPWVTTVPYAPTARS